MELQRLFVDFNAFFASVEQQERAELRGRPVAVVPVMTDTTSCIAASYEARRFGVKTGTRVGDARRLCPGLVPVLARHELYVRYHRQLMAVVDSVVPILSVQSIDEVLCELPQRWRSAEAARDKAREIKQRIAAQTPWIKCSVGIAPNGFLAKTAADMHKPDGLTVLEPAQLPQALFALELRDFCGIGPRMEGRLHRAGIRTARQLCEAPATALRRIWGGIGGEVFHRQLHGHEVVHAESPQRSIGHSHVLPPDLRNQTDARAVAHRLLQKAARRLRTLDLSAERLGLYLRFRDRDSWNPEWPMAATQDTPQLGAVLTRLWDRPDNPVRRLKPLAVGVTLLDLQPADHVQGGLFETPARPQALRGITDRVQLKFGRQALYFGDAHRAREAAPMRIAFNRIPDPVSEE